MDRVLIVPTNFPKEACLDNVSTLLFLLDFRIASFSGMSHFSFVAWSLESTPAKFWMKMMIDMNIVINIVIVSTNLWNMILNKLASVFLLSTIFRSINGCKSLNESLRILYRRASLLSSEWLEFLEVVEIPRTKFFFGRFLDLLSSSRFWFSGRSYTVKVLEMSGEWASHCPFYKKVPHYVAYSLWQRGTSNLRLFSVRNPYENQHGGSSDPTFVQQFFLPANQTLL